MKVHLLGLSICVLLLSTFSLDSQSVEPDGWDTFELPKTECIADFEREIINRIIEENIDKYNIPRPTNKSMMVLHDWPIGQNPAFDYNSTFGISNYVDHDPTFPNQLEDFNCGTHTYDTNSGYNHQGIDIYLWPFDHNQVANDHTYVIASAPGTILAKNDGEVDNHCAFNNDMANYVIIEHSDGSRSWYWHMKKNSVTNKGVGQAVVAGEYLGVVASSGNSTGPHLHFECYDDNLDLIDPYSGSCNGMNATSFWNSQKPYWEPTINTLLTHSAPPSLQACPALDITNEANSFNQGATVYFAAYYHDQLTTSTTAYTIKYPNGTNYASWNHTSNGDYRSSYWYWIYNLPANATIGTWTWNATLDGFTVSRDFEIVGPCPSSYSTPNGNPLTGIQSTSADFETDGKIESTQVIMGATTIVDYDSGTSICLDPGFEVIAGALFQAFIDGCGGSSTKPDLIRVDKN